MPSGDHRHPDERYRTRHGIEPEIERMLRFRDWLRANEQDRDLYARTKRELARRD